VRVREPRLRRATLVLSVLGIAVAGYLTAVHYTGLDAVCVGGGGGCERVQSSEQSELLGVPVALLGLGAYLVLAATSVRAGETARVVAALTALVGFGFSAYLTYVSIADIGATCQWCLISAALMTLLAVVSTTRLLAA
jgi:uncharacterized membrane protein